MANNFLAGTAFIDANSDGKLGTGESYLAGATIQLQTPAGVVLATDVTDSKGGYFFGDQAPFASGVPAGNYKLVSLSAPGFAATSTQALSKISPVTATTSNSIDVTLADPADLKASINTGAFTLGRDLDYKVFGTLVLGSGGQLPLQLHSSVFSPNPTDPFLTLCTDLFNILNGGANGPYVVTPDFVPLGSGSPHNGERVAYLYNQYGQSPQGATFDDQRNNAAALQIAVWELLYDAVVDLDNGNFQVANFSPTDPPAVGVAVRARATALLLDSIGKSEAAIFLNVLPPSPTVPAVTNRQGIIVTGSFNFGNKPVASLGDVVWNDLNANGKQDNLNQIGGEPGIPGVTVTLTNSSGNPVFNVFGVQVAPQVTDPTGGYLFTNLVAGTYKVAFSNLPSGYVFTTQDVGANGFDTVDSDANAANGMTGNYTLISGDNNLTVDAGAYLPASLGNFVWNDLNGNGKQDGSEPGIDGVTATLTGIDGLGNAVNLSQNTTGGGAYLFSNLVPGDYKVTFSNLPSGYVFTTQDVGANGFDTVDSDANTASGMTGTYTLISGDNNLTVDAGAYLPASLGNFVWNDLNGNGKQDGGEPGIDGVTATLTGTDGLGNAVNVSQITAGGGAYLFSNLVPGEYKVTFSNLPAGYVFTAQDVSANGFDTVDSDANTGTGATGNYTLISGDDNLTVDAGAYLPVAIGNYVWVDVNNNGLQDEAASFGVNGVTVTLFTSGGTQVGSPLVTGPDGSGNPGFYLFTDVDPGAYYVVFTAPSGQVFTTTGTVATAGNDSNADSAGKTADFTLVSGVDDLTIDAGLRPIDLSLTKTIDNATPTVGSNVVYTLTVTNANGFSNASGVVVKDVLPTGLNFVSATFSDGTDTFAGNLWTIGSLNAGQSATLTITATVTNGGTKTNYAEVNAAGQFDIDSTPNNNSNNEDDDDQVSLTPSASIGNYVWVDVNNNGLQDEAASFGVNGVTVTLFTSGGTQVGSPLVTGPDGSGNPGYYLFTDVDPGAYYVVFTAPSGQVFTTTGTVATAGDDSNADSAGKTANFTLVSGVDDLTIDAGLRPIDLSLTKTIDNATPTVGSNVVYTLTVTNANGFSNASGVVVKDVLPTGLNFVSATFSDGTDTFAGNLWTIGSLNAGQSATLTITATVTNGGTKTNYAEVNAAGQFDIDSTPNNNSNNEDDDDQVSLTPSASIGNYVWVDVNNNGLQDEAASFGVNGVTVTLFTSGGTQVGSPLVTGPDGSGNPGFYLFTDVDPGAYYVVFTAPSGQVFTTTGTVATAGNDSNADSAGKTADFTLVSGVDDLTIDAGLRPIDLSLSKTIDNATPTVGSNVVYTLTVTNANGFSNASGVVVKDVLPTGLNFVSATFSDGTDTFAGNLWTIGSLNAGQSATLTITATVTNGGTKTNYAEVNAAGQFDIDSTPNNNSNNEDDDDQVSLTPSASIGNYVWVDVNNNGLQDEAASFGVNGVTVTLFTSGGTQVGSPLVTGPDGSGNPGFYLFTDVDPGAYYVVFTAPSGQVFTTTGTVATAGNDSNADSAGKTADFTLVSGVDDLTIDAGLRPIDLSLSKTIDNATPTVGSNVVYTLTVTNANGFSNASGVVVKDVLPTGLNFVSATSSDGTDTFAGNLWTIGSLNAGQSATLTITATVTNGGTKTNYAEVNAASQFDIDSTPNNNSNNEDDDDQVSLTPSASIGNYVWVDVNNNGIQDEAASFGVNGVTVTLFTSGGTQVGSPLVTGPDGSGNPGFYLFTDVDPGAYYVVFTAPSGQVFTTTGTVATAGNDSNAGSNGRTADFTLVSGVNDLTIDAGLRPIDLSLSKTIDNATPTVGSNVVYTLTVTNANGFSNASGVVVKDVLPTGLNFVSATFSDGTDTFSGNLWTIGSLSAGQSATLTITATVTNGGTKTNYAEVNAAGQFDIDSTPNNNSNNEDDDDQVSLTPSASIGNYVWVDVNNNGLQDEAASFGVNGVTVTLFTSGGTQVGSPLVTGPDGSGNPGFYLFTDVDPGAYYVVFTAPSGQVFTTTGTVATAGNDSNAGSNGRTADFTLVSGVNDLTIDAGLRPIDLSLSKTIDNATPTVGSNVVYTLTVTNANGFSNASGVVVKDVLPTGLNFVSATFSDGTDTFAGNLWTIGSLNAGQSATLTITATVTNGGTKTNYAEVNAAGQFDIDSTPNNNSNNEDDDDQVSLTPSASIGNYVWVDVNNNGLQDEAASFGVNGVTVTLFTSGGTQVGSPLVTGPDGSGNPGFYLFTDVDPGAYYVVFTAPSGQVFTTTGTVATAGNDSNADSAGKTADFTLVSGVNDLTIDAGLRPIDLSLSKTIDNATPTVGSNVVYTLTVTNANGFSNASGVVVKDVLPTGLNFVSATFSDGTDTFAGNLWTIGNLNAGQSATLTITATVTNGGTKTNYAEVNAAGQFDIDSTPNNNSNNEDDDDQVSLTPSASIGNYVWVDVNNNGIQDEAASFGVNGVTVTLFTSGGTQVGSPLVTGPDGSGNPGFYLFTDVDPDAYYVVFTAPSGQVFTTTGTVATAGNDSNADSAGKTADFTLVSGVNDLTIDAGLRPIDLSLSKTIDNATPTVGSNVVYTLTVTNANGFSNASGVVVKDVLPTGLNFVSATFSDGTDTFAGNLWTIGSLNAGQSATLTITATVTNGGTKTNYAEVNAAGQFDIDSTPNNNSNNEDDDDQVSLTPSASIGNYVWVDVNNNGLQDEAASFGVNGVTVTLFTSGGTQVGSPIVTGPDGSGNPGFYLFTDVDPGAYYVVFTAPNGQVFTTTGTVATAGNDSNAGSNGRTADFTLVSGVNDLTIDAGLRPIDLSLTKTVSNAGPTIGSNVNFTLTVNNASGFSTATGVAVRDVLPSGLTLVSSTATQGAYAGNIWTIGSLTAGQTVTLTITATVATGGTKTNYAEVSAANQIDVDSTPNNNSTNEDDDDQVTVSPVAQLVPRIDIEKTTNGPSNSNPVAPDYDNEDLPTGAGVPVLTSGTAVTWTYRVANTGNVAFATSDIVVVDDNGTPSVTTDDLSIANGKIIFASVAIGNADNVLDPNEVWLYRSTGLVQTIVVPGTVTSLTGANVLASYSFDSASNLGRDDSGSNRPITFAGAVSQVTGPRGNGAIDITGGAFGNIASMTTGGAMTIATWVRFDSTSATGWERVIDLGQTTSGGIGNIYIGREGTTNNLTFTIEKNGSYTYRATAINAIANGTWMHVAGTVNASGNMVLYINGNAVATQAGVAPDVGVRTNQFVGKSNWPDGVFDGAIDELSISNGAMSASDIASLYQQSTTIDFQGGTALDGTNGNVMTFSSGGISVKASAFSRSDSGVWSTAYLGSYGGGLGVTDNLDGNGSGDTHTVDNMGGSDNYVLLEFSKAVILDSAFLGYVVGDSDVTVWIGSKVDPFNNHATSLSDAYLNSLGFTEVNLTTLTGNRTVDLNSVDYAGNVVIIAAKVDESTNDDRFKIQNIVLKPTAPATYANKVVITVPGATDFDMSHYKNPGAPAIDIEKTTNGPSNSNPIAPDYDNEDAANGAGVPVLAPGSAVTWTYRVSNTGNVAFATSDIVIVDDDGTPTNTTDDLSIANGRITFASVSVGDADNVLEPGEVWLYRAVDTVQTVLIPGTGPSTTIDFQGNTALDGTNGNIMTFSSGGISVKASAFSRSDSGSWSTAYLGSYGGGLGVTDNLDGSGAGDTHTVDNMGGSDNYVLFEFSQSVIVDAATLGYVVGDSDLTVWIGTTSDPFNNHLTLSDALLTSLGFVEVNQTTLTSGRIADINGNNLAGNVLVIAAQVDEPTNEDRFKIQNVVLRSTVAGTYKNTGVITVPGATDFDFSHYKNPDPTICTHIATTGNTSLTGAAGNTLTFGSGNISVRASAFSRTDAAPNTWNTAYLGAYSGGLGVTDGSESGSSNTHTVDNAGGRDNYILFEFSQPVLIDKAILGYVAGDSDITVWIGTRNDPFTNRLTLSDSLLSGLGYTEDNTTTLTSARTADINAQGIVGNVLVIAAQANDLTPEDYFKISGLSVCTPARTKFFVVNDSTTSGVADRTFEYTTSGSADENYVLNSANTAPRGASATAAGDKVWVVDANSRVYVYNNSGGLLGSWTATLPTGATPEGIATNGTDVWIVTSDGNTTGRNTTTERMFQFSGATSGTGANRLGGTQSPVSSWALNTSNLNPKDVVTDGTSLWVVNDASTGDRVFRYNLTGGLHGSWMIDAANTSPTGIALDPANVSNLWIVDNGTDRVYQYNSAANLTSGNIARAASTSFALSAGNTNPQGIADPPVWGQGVSEVEQAVTFDVSSNESEVSSVVTAQFNADQPTDVNGDGVTTPLDALLVINQLNGRAAQGALYHDVNNDGVTSPLDALLVVNHLDAVRNSVTHMNSSKAATEQVFAEMGEGEVSVAFDELFADVATQWAKTGSSLQNRRINGRVK